MRKIAFICHGNICRSVMAEFILRDYIEKNNITDIFVSSFAVSSEEIGNTIYYAARDTLINHNIKLYEHKAQQFCSRDYLYFDEIYYMDNSNYNRLLKICPDNGNKYHPLLMRPVSDPWYTRDFETCFLDLEEGIKKIIGK